MHTQVSKSRFKAQALEIFRKVEESGEPVIVTDHGRPTLIVRKYHGPTANLHERLKGSVLRYDAPFDPVDDTGWDAMA